MEYNIDAYLHEKVERMEEWRSRSDERQVGIKLTGEIRG